MQKKKAHLTLKLTPTDTAMVKVGDMITPGIVLVSSSQNAISQFNLAELLNISPKDLKKYLLVASGDKVEKHQAIARLKGLMRKKVIKVPIDGIFTIVDADAGIVGVSQPGSNSEITSWFNGKVDRVDEGTIVFEVIGEAITGTAGQGDPVSGALFVVANPVDVFSMPIDLDQKILVLPEVTADVLAKADALGVSAVITQKLELPPFTLPYVLVENIEILHGFHSKNSIVYGAQKQILIIEEAPHPKDTPAKKNEKPES